jgi:hypothetical protein
MTEERRAPKGQPTGGEFTAKQYTEGDIVLRAAEPGTLEYRIAESKAIAASHTGFDLYGGFDTVKADDAGTLSYFNNGKLHNDAGPAKQFLNGRVEYRVDGKLHNPYDGPTLITEFGRMAFHRNGKKINAPEPEAQLHGLVRGTRAGFYDIQWVRHHGAELIGGDLDTFDRYFERISNILDQEQQDTGSY